MDFVTVISAVSQFHKKLDEIARNQSQIKETLLKLQHALEVVVLNKKIDQMSISDDEKEPFSSPLNAQGRISQHGSTVSRPCG